MTANQNKELLISGIVIRPCPWCGEKPLVIRKPRANYISCNSGSEKCPVSPNTRHWTASNWRNVVNAWNKRNGAK